MSNSGFLLVFDPLLWRAVSLANSPSVPQSEHQQVYDCYRANRYTGEPVHPVYGRQVTLVKKET